MTPLNRLSGRFTSETIWRHLDTIMIHKWPELLAEMLATLTGRGTAALDLFVSPPRPHVTPSIDKCNKAGLDSPEEYQSVLREGKLWAYVNAVRAPGREPVRISPAQRRGLEDIGGLVVTGGGDTDPALYGAVPHAQTKHVPRERDELERDLIQGAQRKDLPILAICRGLQMLNVLRGGR